MSQIRVDRLSFTYPGSFTPVFENVSFTLDTDWKLGLVGRNGRGKTTFFRLLMKEFAYSGRITASVPFDYFPYSVPDEEEFSLDIARAVCRAEDWQIQRELSLLNVDDGVLYRPFYTLSNGEKTKVLLAALFLKEGNFLLIDEPTNHLDAAARKAVSAYLNRKKGFILVSHDRTFLDGCVDHILSLNRTDIEVCSGNFSSWYARFEARQKSELQRNEHLKRDINRLKEAAKRSETWSSKAESAKYGTTNSGLSVDRGFVGHKAAKTMKRSKTIEARQQKAMEEKEGLLKNLEETEDLKLFPLRYHSDLLASFDSVAVSYDGRQVNAPVSFEIRRGDRIALDGSNGSGKSSLLKLLLGHPTDHTGTVSLGSGLTVSYVPQDTSFLRGTLSDYARARGIDETLFFAILRKMDFERILFSQEMSSYSGGQKKKVVLAASLCEKAHLYLWDEPLNFIDVYSRLQTERLLQEYSPTMIFVEHDAAFRAEISTKTVRLTPFEKDLF